MPCPPRSDEEDLDPPNDSVSQLFKQGMAKLVHLFEESMEQQRLQLQSFTAEQANLCTLLKSQQEQILQRLDQLGTSSTSLRARSKAGIELNETQSKPLQLTSLQSMPEVQQAQESKEKEASKVQATSSTVNAGQGMVIDFGQLPETWNVRSQAAVPKQSKKMHWLLERVHDFVASSKFDAIFVWAIVANLVSISVQLHWRGYYVDKLLGYRESDNGFVDAEGVFEALELIYTSIFALELLLRVVFVGAEFLIHFANAFDALIVLTTCVSMFILEPAGVLDNASFVAVARLIRLVRVTRFLKVVRFAESCSELRILARALSESIGCLFWSFLLLISIIAASAIVLFQLVLPYVEDESNPMEWRIWAHDQFGSLSLCVLALWECTFTGSWHRFTRTMIIKMNVYYVLFWVPYIVCINFSVMRLIGALFLKQTMSAAAVDSEKMTMARMKKQRLFAESIREIFVEADHSGHGKLSYPDFVEMLNNEHVGDCFEKLDLEVSEVAALFELLAADDGAADYHEFLDGALKLKQNAQIIDVIQLIHGNQKLSRALQTTYSGLCTLADALGVPLAKSALRREGTVSGDAKHMIVRSHSRAQLGGQQEQAQEEDQDVFDDAGGD